MNYFKVLMLLKNKAKLSRIDFYFQKEPMPIWLAQAALKSLMSEAFLPETFRPCTDNTCITEK